MAISTRVAPPNSLVLIVDGRGGDVPASMRGSIVAATDSCIAVGCRAEDDGDTEITLGALEDTRSDDRLAYDGWLETPSRKVVVRSVEGADFLEMPVASEKTNVRVWVNDPQEPDRITVGIA